MSASTSEISLSDTKNERNVTQPVCDKNKDVEKGEIQLEGRPPSSSCLRPTSTSATKTSAESKSELDNRYRRNSGEVSVEVEVEVAPSNTSIGGSNVQETYHGWTNVTASVKAGTAAVPSTTTRTGTGEANRWKTVGRLLWHLTLAMFLIVILVGCLALLTVYVGPIFMVQLFVVVLVAYLVSGGRFRWFYVAIKTLPRDLKAILRYINLLWLIRCHERKNRSVADAFRQCVRRHPNKVCLICEEQEWTFQQLEDFSNRIATVFKAQGYRKGNVVALLLENRVEYVGIWLGLSKLGVIIPLINTNLRKASLLHSIKVANCQAVIYGAEFSEAMSDIAELLDPMTSLYRYGNSQNSVSFNPNAKDLITIMSDVSAAAPVLQEKGDYNDRLLYIYTSGTTGLPKAAVITNSRFMFMTYGIFCMVKFRNSDRIYTPLPLYHTAGGIMSIGASLLQGSTTVIRKKFSASAYFNDCIKYNCTIGQYIGEMCRYILAVPQKQEDKQHKIRLMFGNGLKPQIWPEFVERFNVPQIAEFYGATEGNANIVNIDNTEGAIGFISRIIPSVYPISIIKVNSDGEPIRNAKGLCQVCEPDEPGVFVGKIIASNPGRAFLGYVDQNASKKKVVHDVFTKGDSAFLSGDILVADEMGYLFFKDRTGDTFRWKGENVSTSEVEAIISNIINYRDCIVYGVEIRGTEGRAGMAAIYDEDSTLDISQLTTNIKGQLPNYAWPQFIRILTKIDLTGTFKLKKKDLQAEGYDPNKINDKLYYLEAKLGYQVLTTEKYKEIQEGNLRF